MVTLSERCPLCKKQVSLEVSKSRIVNRKIYPITFVDNEIFMEPEPHRHIFYVDSHFSCRGVAYALVNAERIENFKFMQSETSVARSTYFFILDYNKQVADCRLMGTLSYHTVVLEVQNLIDTLKAYSKSSRDYTSLEFDLTLRKNVSGIHVFTLTMKNKLGVLLYTGKKKVNIPVLKTAISLYTPEYSTEKLKFLINLVFRTERISKSIIETLLNEKRIKFINFQKFKASIPDLKDDLKAILTRLEHTNYQGKTPYQLISILKVNPLNLSRFLILLTHYNSIEFY